MAKTIRYDPPVVDLIDEVNKTGRVTHSRWKKKSVTFHHNEATLTHVGALSAWRSRGISMHFDVDLHGRIAQGVIANEYAFAVGDNVGNEESIHIDMADKTSSPKWEISEDTMRSAARLAGWLFVHEIDEHPSRDNVYLHDHWLPSAHCPGPFVEAIFDEFLAEIQGWYENFRAEQKTPVTFNLRNDDPADFEQVKLIQTAVGIEPDGIWDLNTDQAVLEFRRKHLRR